MKIETLKQTVTFDFDKSESSSDVANEMIKQLQLPQYVKERIETLIDEAVSIAK